MARSNLPGNILKSLNTRLLGDLAQGIQNQQGVQTEQLAGLEQGVDDFSKIRAQDIISDLQVHTGNPVLDMQKRQEVMDKFKEAPGFADKRLVNKAFRDISQQAPKDYIQEWDAENRYRTELGKKFDTSHIQNLPSSMLPDGKVNPDYKAQLESDITEAKSLNLSIPKEQGLYENLFNSYDVKIGQDTKNYIKQFATSPDKYNTTLYEDTLQMMTKNLGGQFPGITDVSKLRSKAKTALDKSEFGQSFRRRIDEESKETIDDVAMQKLTTGMSNAARTLAASTGANFADNYEAYKKSVNDGIAYLNTNNITGDAAQPIESNVLNALQRDNLSLDSIIAGNKKWADELATGEITPSTEKKIQAEILAHYKRDFPELTDGIFRQRYDELKNDAGSGISVAITEGRIYAESLAKVKATDREAKFNNWKKANTTINNIESEGLLTHLYNKVFNKWKTKFGDVEKLDPETDKELKEALQYAVRTLDAGIGKKLPESGPARDAYNLTTSRMLTNELTWDPKEGVWIFSLDADIGLTGKSGIMDKDTLDSRVGKMDIYDVFKRNILPPKAIRKASGDMRKIRSGSEELKDTVRGVTEQSTFKTSTSTNNSAPLPSASNIFNLGPNVGRPNMTGQRIPSQKLPEGVDIRPDGKYTFTYTLPGGKPTTQVLTNDEVQRMLSQPN